MLSSSTTALNSDSESNINNKSTLLRRFKWFILFFLAFGCIYSLSDYVKSRTSTCVRYVNGRRYNTYEGKEDCTSKNIFPSNRNIELRPEVHFEIGYLIGSGLCFIAFVGIFACFVLPRNCGNYRTWYRRSTCCCLSISLKEGIYRYMNGYISEEESFKKVINSCQQDLHTIVEGLKNHITEMTFDVLFAGSMQERLGKPTFVKLNEEGTLPMKSILSSDFDVMLTPKLPGTDVEIFASPPFTPGPALFNVVKPPNSDLPGFVWLRMNEDYQESRSLFWKNLCIETTFPDGSTRMFLSSFEVRNVFVEGMKRLRHDFEGNCLFHWCSKLRKKYVNFKVKVQGPAVTVKLQQRRSWSDCGTKVFLPTLFYGDFIFAIRCTGWPEEANDWSKRYPRFWPEPQVVSEVKNAGYHVVPKPSFPFLDEKKKKKKKKDNVEPLHLEYEWRLSYSLAEITLSKKIPPAARACLLALKATIKRHPKKTAGCVSSYHLKTVLYYTLEKKALDFWREENIEECFKELVHSLLECALDRNCPHYFMPEVNLMATVGEQNLARLSDFLLKLEENPMKYVSSSNLRCHSNLAAFYECMYYNHGDDFYMDIY